MTFMSSELILKYFHCFNNFCSSKLFCRMFYLFLRIFPSKLILKQLIIFNDFFCFLKKFSNILFASMVFAFSKLILKYFGFFCNDFMSCGIILRYFICFSDFCILQITSEIFCLF